MAVSTIAGQNAGGVQLPCILYEGAPTVTTVVHGMDGYYDKGMTFASPLAKDDWVTLDVQVENTYAATGGVPVVKAIATGTTIIGQIISEPTIQVFAPSTTAGNSWAKQLAGKYYRVATVWFPGVTGVTKANLLTADSTAIVPGVQATLKPDASDSVALTGGVTTLSFTDCASGGVGAFSFHYAAKQAAATFSILVGFTGGTVVIT